MIVSCKGPFTVMVVEDDETAREGLVEYINKFFERENIQHGEIVKMASYDSAMLYLKQHGDNFACMLLDYLLENNKLSEKTGMRIYEHMMRTYEDVYSRVIMITGAPQLIDAATPKDLPQPQLLSKPLMTFALNEALARTYSHHLAYAHLCS